MRASPRLGCAMDVPRDPALGDAPVTHGRTAPSASIEGGSVPGHQSTTSGGNVTSTPSCLYLRRALCGPLAVLDIGAVVDGRSSDGGPRRAVTTATLKHNGCCAARCTFRIHRYGVAVEIRASGVV
jgi:hypothetical protein